jgi:uncharacterized membrane protein
MLIFVSIFILVIGILFKLFPPKKINGFYGYRTFSSMRDIKSWNYAQKIGAYSFIVLSVVLLIIGLLFMIFNYNNYTVEATIFLFGFCTMFITDEIMVRKHIKGDK